MSVTFYIPIIVIFKLTCKDTRKYFSMRKFFYFLNVGKSLQFLYLCKFKYNINLKKVD